MSPLEERKGKRKEAGKRAANDKIAARDAVGVLSRDNSTVSIAIVVLLEKEVEVLYCYNHVICRFGYPTRWYRVL